MDKTDEHRNNQSNSSISYSTSAGTLSSNHINLRSRRQKWFKRIGLSLGFIVALVMFGALVYNLVNDSGTNTSNQVKSVFSDETMKDYESPDKKFTIKMPGLPTVNQSKSKLDSQDIPLTTYQRLIDNDSKNYTVGVYDYSSLNTADRPDLLEKTLGSLIQTTKGAELVSSTPGEHDGVKSINADYKIKDGDTTHQAYARFIMKDSQMYAVLLVGGDSFKFNEFANSLKIY